MRPIPPRPRERPSQPPPSSLLTVGELFAQSEQTGRKPLELLAARILGTTPGPCITRRIPPPRDEAVMALVRSLGPDGDDLSPVDRFKLGR